MLLILFDSLGWLFNLMDFESRWEEGIVPATVARAATVSSSGGGGERRGWEGRRCLRSFRGAGGGERGRGDGGEWWTSFREGETATNSYLLRFLPFLAFEALYDSSNLEDGGGVSGKGTNFKEWVEDDGRSKMADGGLNRGVGGWGR
ncbi:hypothetical protein Salat_1153000 [Sesamum alatum]|uniref:Uncharacterized protein n=1 Tax=Sesamum alatum TaxID=300844 RepID=A0AAE1YFC7_9LAMI|nr:hypothetical protein Salat_1153000 [Sesamum alatum]